MFSISAESQFILAIKHPSVKGIQNYSIEGSLSFQSEDNQETVKIW